LNSSPMAGDFNQTEFPSVPEFSRMLLTESREQIVSRYIFGENPYIFRDKPELMLLLRKHLSERLNLSEKNIVIVGSAKLGFSLSPHNFPREFTSTSDIDILVVDTVLFDSIWTTLREWWYPRRATKLGGAENEWAGARRKDVFWGWIVPHEIRYEGLSFPETLKPLRDISTKWFNAFKSLSLYSDFATRDVTSRLYRSWEHALQYHSDGLRQISEKLKTQGMEDA